MKLTVAAATAVAVLVAAPLAAAAAAPSAAVVKRCHVPRGGRTIRKTKQVLVFKSSVDNTFYCARPNGRKILMGTSQSEAVEFISFQVDHVRIAGRFVAYRSWTSNNGAVQSPAFNLVGPRGNVVTGLSVGPDDGILFPTADGGLVWLVGSGDMAQLRATGGPYGEPGPPPPLLAPETRGRVLDTGAIDPASVQVTGNTVTWVNAGVARTFTPGA
jgi:hypothetical protein